MVEDNPGDVRLAREAFHDADVAHQFHWVRDGVEALAFLRREGCYHHSPRPDLVLLDLKLPRKDGQEFLEELRRDQELAHLPVFVLTSGFAGDPSHQRASRQANVFLTKPKEIEAYVAMARSIGDTWQQWVSTNEVWKTAGAAAPTND